MKNIYLPDYFRIERLTSQLYLIHYPNYEPMTVWGNFHEAVQIVINSSSI